MGGFQYAHHRKEQQPTETPPSDRFLRDFDKRFDEGEWNRKHRKE